MFWLSLIGINQRLRLDNLIWDQRRFAKACLAKWHMWHACAAVPDAPLDQTLTKRIPDA
jgi:hypothetical protein